MALIEIPTDNSLPSLTEQVKLDGTSYILQLNFNPRSAAGAGKWFITLADQSGNMLVGPVPVVVNWGLFDRFVDLVDLPGSIIAFDTSGNDEDPGQFDLGGRVRLFYLEADST